MGIHVCTNAGLRFFPSGDNNEIANIHWQIFLWTTGPITTKLGTKYALVIRNHVFSNEGPCPFSRRDNNEIVKIYWQTLKLSFEPNLVQSTLGWWGCNFKYIRTIQFSTKSYHQHCGLILTCANVSNDWN